MKSTQVDWARFLAEQARVSPILKTDDVAARLNISEPVVRVALSRLARRGLIEHFGKKLFINLQTAGFRGFELIELLRPLSYISLETVLRNSGISSQTPFAITCVTTGRPNFFRSRSFPISFRHITTSLYWGFEQRTTRYGSYNLAEPEKALLDWFYLQLSQGLDTPTDELNLSKINTNKLLEYSQKYPTTVTKRVVDAIADSARQSHRKSL